MPSPIDLEENDLQSDDEKTVPSTSTTTNDFQVFFNQMKSNISRSSRKIQRS